MVNKYHVTSEASLRNCVPLLYHVQEKSDAQIQIVITTTSLVRINYYTHSHFNYQLTDINVAAVSEI